MITGYEEGWLVIIFSFSVTKENLTRFGADLTVIKINISGKIIMVCSCADAFCFSKDLLRLLLLSEGGEQRVATVALSLNGDRIDFRVLRLHAPSPLDYSCNL